MGNPDKNVKGYCAANGKIIVARGNLSLTSVTGGRKFRTYGHLVRGIGGKMLETVAFLIPVFWCGSRKAEKCS